MIRRIHDLHAVFTSEELGRLHQRWPNPSTEQELIYTENGPDGYIVKLDMDGISR